MNHFSSAILGLVSGTLALGLAQGCAPAPSSRAPLQWLNTVGIQQANPNATPIDTAMTLERIGAILEQEAENVEEFQGQWQFTLGDRPLLLATDVTHDRMRIFTPIISAQDLTEEQWQIVMVANFYTALDARYAITEDGILVSTFLHPLSTLQEQDLRSALYQVANLAETFGTLYSSGALEFDPGQPVERQIPEGLGI